MHGTGLQGFKFWAFGFRDGGLKVVAEKVQGAFYIVNPRELEHRLRMLSAGIPYASPSGHEDNVVPTFWLLRYTITFLRKPKEL